MEILRTISLYTDGKNMPFLLIGGHAVNAYGISRQTGDLDILVQRDSKSLWIELMKKLHYSIVQDDSRFARFTPDTIAAWPIDLMFVDVSTFQKLFEHSRDIAIGATTVKVVSPKHLVTLKIHALKHYQEHRFVKDYNDLLQLLKMHCQDLDPQDLKDLCLRYADLSLYDRIQTDLNERR